jgi:hypothetical protein
MPTGGVAVQLHGLLRPTFDIELVLAMNDENIIMRVFPQIFIYCACG